MTSRRPSVRVTQPSMSSNDEHALSELAVSAFLDSHPEFLERWLESHSSGGLGSMDSLSPGTFMSSRNSVTDELFHELVNRRRSSTSDQLRRASSTDTLSSLDENETLLELIRDIANEFDMHRLCRKILRNVGRLTKADRGSLFLAKGSRRHRYLVAKVFDVRSDDQFNVTEKKDRLEIRIPFGSGIAGCVAQTKELINLPDAYQDPRFNPDVDVMTGYRTCSLLCLPVLNHAGEVIAVAQIINKQLADCEPQPFTDTDVLIFQRYLIFCGIGIQNAQLFELSISEFKKNQILPNLARGIFEEQASLENLVKKIMSEALELLRCQEAVVLLRQADGDEMLSAIELNSMVLATNAKQPSKLPDAMHFTVAAAQLGKFDQAFSLKKHADGSKIIEKYSESELDDLPYFEHATKVLETGQVVSNTDESTVDGNQFPTTEESTVTSKAMLSIPIFNQKQTVIGVAQFINKTNGHHFSDHDIRAVEAFGIFCGLGICNSQMYEQVCRLMAKQRVTLECLSYHATASDEDTQRLVQKPLPDPAIVDLYSYRFNDELLSNDDTCLAVIGMFQETNLVSKYKIPYEVLCRWVLSVKKNYRPVTYHNWRHGLNVAQTMFTLLKMGDICDFISDLHVLGLLVGCLSHDLDHRGTNNAFQLKIDNPLAYLYSTSTMEHHHFDQCLMILNAEGNNILQSLSADDYRDVIEIIRDAILATDLALYFKKRDSFKTMVSEATVDWNHVTDQKLLLGMMMTACDVSAICKPWKIQHRVAQHVSDEFFYQGDLERSQFNAQPIAMMDREKRDELPKMQMGFIDFICIPLYKTLSEAFPFMSPLYEGVQQNRAEWAKLAEQVEMGLTWIDHDTIDDPVETSQKLHVSRITLRRKQPERRSAEDNHTGTQSADKNRHGADGKQKWLSVRRRLTRSVSPRRPIPSDERRQSAPIAECPQAISPAAIPTPSIEIEGSTLSLLQPSPSPQGLPPRRTRQQSRLCHIS